MFSHRKILSFLFLTLLSTNAFAGFSWWMWTPGDSVDNSSQSMFSKGYHPDQPIEFSHKLHAGDRGIDCQYCHSAARRSITSSIPSLDTCMGCHKIVATDKEPIKYITEKYNNNEPVVWTKVHDLPDYVRFTHKRHVQSGLECQECHGPVEEMTTAEQWAPLQMGWCIGCHREKEVVNGTSCNTCHY